MFTYNKSVPARCALGTHTLCPVRRHSDTTDFLIKHWANSPQFFRCASQAGAAEGSPRIAVLQFHDVLHAALDEAMFLLSRGC